MRNAIIKVLLLSILFANLSWAADLDELGSSHAAMGSVVSSCMTDCQSEEGETDPDGLKHGSCDHCCHGSAHYVGALSLAGIVFPEVTSSAPSVPAGSRLSRDQEPPLPPPNI